MNCVKCLHLMSNHLPNLSYDRLFCQEGKCDCVLGQPESSDDIIVKMAQASQGHLYTELLKLYEEYKEIRDKEIEKP